MSAQANYNTYSPPVSSPSTTSFTVLPNWSPLTRKLNFLKGRIFLLTFFSYALYSGTRQPFGITKSALNPDHEKDPDAGPGWVPFNSSNWGSTYLGACDTVFLTFYAIGLFITGPLGDRMNLRWFLGFGMIGSGAFCCMFGLGYFLGIHQLAWFIAANVMAGLLQATGWPSNVTLMTRWFGQGNRGTIMGIWNAQSSVGNIIGKFWATFFLHQFNWGWAFVATGLLCAFVGVLQLLFIIPHPHDVLDPIELQELDAMNSKGRIAKTVVLNVEDEKREREEQADLLRRQQQAGERRKSSASSSVAFSSSSHDDLMHTSDIDVERSLRLQAGDDPATFGRSSSISSVSSARPMHHDDYANISFSQALLVPGVLEYSMCLFFSKLVAYAFTFWLPYYLSNLNYSDDTAGNISTVYDMGGVAGGIIAGWASDYTGKRGIVSVAMLLLSLPGLWVYSYLASYGIVANVLLMFVVGILVNGPYTLISGVVAADLGNHPSLKGNPKAMSTVTGIIDGSGSVGAALQGVVIGIAGKKLGWTKVFYLLEGFCLLAALCLWRITSKEVKGMKCVKVIGGWFGWKPQEEQPIESAVAGGPDEKNPPQQHTEYESDGDHTTEDEPFQRDSSDVALRQQQHQIPSATSSLSAYRRGGGVDQPASTTATGLLSGVESSRSHQLQQRLVSTPSE